MSVTEQVKKYAQEATGISPAGFVVEVLRPKKGIEYHADLDTLEDAEAFIKRMEKKKPKWRMSILAMFRWPIDGEFLTHEVCDAVEIQPEQEHSVLDARYMSFKQVKKFINLAFEEGWNIEDGILLPSKDDPARTYCSVWITVEDKDVDEKPFKIPHWLPRVVAQQRKESECSAAE